MWWITCGECKHEGDADAFNLSLQDECFCPKCGNEFEFEYPDDDYPDDDYGE